MAALDVHTLKIDSKELSMPTLLEVQNGTTTTTTTWPFSPANELIG